MTSYEVSRVTLTPKTRTTWTCDYDTVKGMVAEEGCGSGFVEFMQNSPQKSPVSFMCNDDKVYIRLQPDHEVYLLERRKDGMWLTDESPMPDSLAFDK